MQVVSQRVLVPFPEPFTGHTMNLDDPLSLKLRDKSMEEPFPKNARDDTYFWPGLGIISFQFTIFIHVPWIVLRTLDAIEVPVVYSSWLNPFYST